MDNKQLSIHYVLVLLHFMKGKYIMNLVDYQETLTEQIYDLLVAQDIGININLFGSSGSGKTTIGLGITEYLKEDWKVFYLCGIDSEMSPYLTWHIGTKIFSQKKLNLNLEVSFGISNLVSPIVEVAMPKLEEKNLILNQCEEAIVTGIKKQAEGSSRILFIIDDYDLWDIPSKQLVEKVMLNQLNLLEEYKVSWLFLSEKDKVSFSPDLYWHNIKIDNISDSDILSVLYQNGFSDFLDVAEIKSYAGDNLRLVLLAANYYQKGIGTFNELLDLRINTFSENEKKAISLLEPLSIVDAFFSQGEAAFFLDPTSLDDYELKYQANEYLSVAEVYNLIDGESAYYFSSLEIKKYFKSKLAKSEKRLHYQFSRFLQMKHPEDYYNRGRHIQSSIIDIYNGENNRAWQMLFLAYTRWNFNYGFDKDQYNIIREIRNLIDLNVPIQKEIQLDILNKLLQGWSSFKKYNYRNALLQLQSISESLLYPALRAECLRVILLCFLQLADDLVSIKNAANHLYQLIEKNDFEEDEQYCRAALVMLEVYADRCIDVTKARGLKIKLADIINKHLYSSEFLALNACFNRKAALFYTAEIAFNQTERSVSFYRECNDIKNLYMSLCNNAANAIICGKYDSAKMNLNECINMINKYPPSYFPSVYKVVNNIVLMQYLKNEYNSNDTDEEITRSAKTALAAYKTLLSKPAKEVSYVIYLNWLGLSMLCNENSWEYELLRAEEYFSDTDLFYEYYFRDLKFAGYLMQHNISAAKTELEILNQIRVPLLQPYNAIFQRRRQIQAKLLENPSSIEGNSIKYHKKIKDGCCHIQGLSSVFYGRGFLLSDLQFLSF